MRRFLFASVLCLSACAGTVPQDAPQSAYQVTVAFVTALKAANVYVAMPRCSVAVAPPCSDQATVDKIVTAARQADADVLDVQTLAKDVKAAPSDVAKANLAAQAATMALTQLIPAS